MKTIFKPKYLILILLSCCLTLINQIIFHYVATSDSIRFLGLARQYTEFRFFDPSINAAGHRFYSLFLAIIGSLVSYHPYFIGFVQTIIFCLSAIFLIRELELHYKRNLYGLAVLLFLVPEIHIFNGMVFTESLSFSIMLLAFGMAVRINNQKASLFNLFMVSLFVGISVINRIECAFCVFPIFYFIYPKIKDQLLLSAGTIMSLPIIILLINGEMNYKTFNIFKLTSFHGGVVLFSGNNDNLDGSHHSFEKYMDVYIPKQKIADLNAILALPPSQLYPKRDSFYSSMAFDAWKKSPINQLGVIPQKLAKNWLLPGFFDIYTSDTTLTRGLQLNKILSPTYFKNAWYAPYKHFLYLLIHWTLLLIILLGIFRMNRKDRFQIAVLSLLAFYFMFTIPFCGLPRWHVTIFPLLLIAFIPYVWVEKVNVFISKFAIKN